MPEERYNEENRERMDMLFVAAAYARKNSGCTKVEVGSLILNPSGDIVACGANKAIPSVCRSRGCYRVEVYGNNDKTHRGPGDCRAIHSEIDAICMAASLGKKTEGSTIYVTRYPCEACARAIVAAGIRKVVYGRTQDITLMTEQIFQEAHIEVIHQVSFTADDAVN